MHNVKSLRNFNDQLEIHIKSTKTAEYLPLNLKLVVYSSEVSEI